MTGLNRLFSVLGVGCIVFCLGCSPSPEAPKEKSEVFENQDKFFDHMRRHYEGITKIEPKTPEDYMRIGFAYYSLGEFEKARQYYEKAQGMYEARADHESAAEVENYIRHLD
jgi:tetratricopeptide (TPR) repeat protein